MPTSNKVFNYTVAGGLLASWTIDSANSKPTGLTIDAANVSDLWIVDSWTDGVYQYPGAATRTSGSQTAAASFALSAANGNPQGIADPPPQSTRRQENSRATDLAMAPTISASFAISPEMFSLTRPNKSTVKQSATTVAREHIFEVLGAELYGGPRKRSQWHASFANEHAPQSAGVPVVDAFATVDIAFESALVFTATR